MKGESNCELYTDPITPSDRISKKSKTLEAWPFQLLTFNFELLAFQTVLGADPSLLFSLPSVVPKNPELRKEGRDACPEYGAGSVEGVPPPCSGGLSAGGACPDKPVGKGPGVGLRRAMILASNTPMSPA